MVLRIRYPDLSYDYISAHMIDDLIAEKKILMFYRPSEHQWVDIERDVIRRGGNRRYDGIERRSTGFQRL